ncbi:ParA family protein [Algicella marina]|uniref:Chromosome partitioning protein ParA n=1 Tax=Algicella marina TaxID=2683284 RepID=A0A6P1T4I1_9RHOB|nr:ParA family protein [Algicella marina]QHQ36603.1 AAA family ATPase [Algicella marina]
MQATEAIRISFTNQKGGVGKTTTTVNLGTALALVGKKVLIVDADPQGNASTGFGIGRARRAVSIHDVLSQTSGVEEAILPTGIENLDIITATVDLSSIDVDLIHEKDRFSRLRTALSSSSMPKYDYILIDCPPSLNLLTIAALTASDFVLVPLQCEFFALEGLSQLLESIKQIRAASNRDLKLLGVVLTMFDTRNRLSDQVAMDVRENLGSLVLDTIIPRNVRLSEAPSHGVPGVLYDPRSVGSIAYRKLAAEVLRKTSAVRAEGVS